MTTANWQIIKFQFAYEGRDMENIIWLVIMIPTSALFTGLGVFAWRRKKPMWFYSGSTVKENEIADIPRYNRANGIMWLVFSAVFWISTVLGWQNMAAGGIVLMAGSIIALPLLPFIYSKIYAKYKRK